MTEVVDIHTLPQPVRLGVPCRWCGGELMAIGQVYRGIELQGLRELVYRHVATGEEACTVTYKARPYDGWQATAAFEKAQARMWDRANEKGGESGHSQE